MRGSWGDQGRGTDDHPSNARQPRPRVDTVKGSRHTNKKELRTQHVVELHLTATFADGREVEIDHLAGMGEL